MENYPTFYNKPWPLDKQTLPVPGSQAPGFSHIYRSAVLPDFKTNHTIYEVFLHATALNPNADCAGWRPYDLNTKQHANFFEWLSYAEIEEQRTALGSALSKLARDGALGDDVGQSEWSIGIWALNRPEFLVIDQSALAYSRRVVSLYDSYDTPTASYIINHAEARIIFTTPSHVAAVLSEKQAGNLPLLKGLVIIDPFRLAKHIADKPNPETQQRDLLAKQWAATVGVKTYAWSELLQLGRANIVTHIPPKYDTIASFCYTSGTTGKPKAAIINCGMSAYCCAAFQFQLTRAHTMISYLPTAHIYARGVEYVTLSNGGRIGYFQGDTTRLIEDLQILKPTFFPSVPRVLNRIAALIEAQANAPGLKAKLLRRAIDAKVANHDADGTITHAIYDRLVFKKVKAVLGGNVEFVVSGSAPIRPEVLKLLRVAFVCDVREGYGQTENSGFCLIMNPKDNSLGTCGPCWPGMEIKLRDIPEMGYTSQDKPFPRGELLVRGQSVFPGYYKDEAKTKETIDDDGWLRSGDVVLIDDRNRCKIIDRVKSLVKLSQGEYVAIDALTEFYGRNPLSAQILVHGDSYSDYLVGVVVPEPTTFAPFASKITGRQISPEDPAALADACNNEQVVSAYLAEYTKIARANKLKGFEFLKGIHLTMDAFSVENGLLTPTLKLKRHEAAKVYKDVIDGLYARGPANVSSSSQGKL